MIKKKDDFYYVFYADTFKGDIELKGLDKSKKYYGNILKTFVMKLISIKNYS